MARVIARVALSVVKNNWDLLGEDVMSDWHAIKRDIMQQGIYLQQTLSEHLDWYKIMTLIPQLRQEFGFRRGRGVSTHQDMLRWGQITISLMTRVVDLTPFCDRRT